MKRDICVHISPTEIIVVLTSEECDEIIDALDISRDTYDNQEDIEFNRGVRRKMISKAKKARRLERSPRRDTYS